MQTMKLVGVGAVLVLFMVLALWGQMFENVDADEIMVLQAPTTGELTVYTMPGIKWQGFGTVTIYRKLSDTDFDSKIMFNDNGTGQLRGKFQVEMPLDAEHMLSLHTKYGSQAAIEHSLVKPTIDKVIYMTGPLMSSKESSAERKTDLIRYIVDEIEHGVYRTTQRTITVEDQASKEKRTVTVAEIALRDGKPERQEDSALNEFGIRIVNFAPRELKYDEAVEKQILKQQDITMQVQTARAQALEAEQRRITAQANGEAEVMKARYSKEVEKIEAVTQAQRDLEVQTLKAKEAEQYKREQILRGEGDAEAKRLVMSADGALNEKLNAYIEANKAWANAMASYQGNIVPTYQTGSTAGTNGALTFMDLMTAKTAKDLAVDLSVTGRDKTARK
jgi:regulator of protease activity HflC (stomatin/prohibitin superfamily)